MSQISRSQFLRVIALVHGLIVVWPNHWRRPELALVHGLIVLQLTHAITLLLYTSSHVLEMFWRILGVVVGPIKSPKDRILAVDPCRKRSDYLCNHSHSYNNGSIAFVLLAHHWLASSCVGVLLGVGNRAVQLCRSQINCTVASNSKV